MLEDVILAVDMVDEPQEGMEEDPDHRFHVVDFVPPNYLHSGWINFAGIVAKILGLIALWRCLHGCAD